MALPAHDDAPLSTPTLFGNEPVDKGSPMMEQFWRAKKEAPDALVFFRMGDFYELFHEDAVVAARVLGLTLTSRSKGDDAVPMAGVPVRNAETYIVRLVKRGHKVAICEQLEDPRTAKGIVERGIVRIVTPGTLTEEHALDAKENNYLASLFVQDGMAGLVWVDVSTGYLRASDMPIEQLADELERVTPTELLARPNLVAAHPEIGAMLAQRPDLLLTSREEWRFERSIALRALLRQFKVHTLAGFGIDDASPIVPAAGALLEYVEETQRGSCLHLRGIERVSASDRLVLDRATRTCLELVATQRDGRREGTLLDTIDATLTAMGSRRLREWLLAPLVNPEAIRHRQEGVAELVAAPFVREQLREDLAMVLDVERLASRVSTGRSNARDLVALATSLRVVPRLKQTLASARSDVLADLERTLDTLEELTSRIERTLVERPPLTIKDGGIVRRGFSQELDDLMSIAGDARSWMARFQAEEIERSNLPGLRIGFNAVFGYYIEVPRGQIDRVPAHYVRKQTIKSAERYITPELKEFETRVLRSEELARDLEHQIFVELRAAVAGDIGRILDTAASLGRVDVLAALAHVAAAYRYVAPEIDAGDLLEIEEGRHPVIERSAACATFVPNDCSLDLTKKHLTILTGPNMAGKSTFIRQIALIALLAQIGSFVPARRARIGVVDRIFTRVGAGDDISRGSSTFMVEMVEIANILNNATRRSLVILDEVGRGTSTFDGLALAWSIAEHLHERVKCRALFATHYHQLVDLAERYPGVDNRNVAVREWGDEIVFLHKIVAGGTDRSYGIQVARLAGVPLEVVDRARSILSDLEGDEEGLARRILARSFAGAPSAPALPASLFRAPSDAIFEELRRLDVESMTPIQALLALSALSDLARPRK